ncbi:anthrone oxygenase family protein [Nocardioides sp. CN2-186]|uniref:anthrone oxygenase family protein n=1 Tax=Nocardioides tweenelious TaxID=3156607 RepID=UPI0032B31244
MSDLLDTLRSPVLLAATVLTGLQAGTYYTWACGVMPGLARTDDHTFVSSMNHINVAIVNPVFMLSFLGAPALAIAAVLTTTSGARGWAIAGLALALGTVVVTAVGNVPLNDALAAGGSRADFETLWVRWNIVRTVTSTAALGCLAWAALRS